MCAGKSCEEKLLQEIVDASGAFFPLSVSHLSADVSHLLDDVASNPVVVRAGKEMPPALGLHTGGQRDGQRLYSALI